MERLVPILRQRLNLSGSIDDSTILDSLLEIVRQKDPHKRWQAAFNSRLGLYLVLLGRDLNSALNSLLAILPPTRR